MIRERVWIDKTYESQTIGKGEERPRVKLLAIVEAWDGQDEEVGRPKAWPWSGMIAYSWACERQRGKTEESK